jgi:hypothetical protein
MVQFGLKSSAKTTIMLTYAEKGGTLKIEFIDQENVSDRI